MKSKVKEACASKQTKGQAAEIAQYSARILSILVPAPAKTGKIYFPCCQLSIVGRAPYRHASTTLLAGNFLCYGAWVRVAYVNAKKQKNLSIFLVCVSVFIGFVGT